MAEEEKGFTVRDRRFFSETSDEEKAGTDSEEQQTKVAPEPESPQPEADAAGTGPEADGRSEAGGEDAGSTFPQIDFSTFVFSLNSSALVHLGVLEEPGTGEKVKNLPLAKQTIDLLGMLEEKTRGNLTKDEENLLKSMLHDLRLMYVKEKK